MNQYVKLFDALFFYAHFFTVRIAVEARRHALRESIDLDRP